MAFRQPRRAPEFADLKVILARTKGIDESLYQVVQEIIDRLGTFQFAPSEAIVIDGGGGNGGGEGGATAFATYLTRQNDTAVLPNSAQELARYGMKFDDTVANKRYVDLDLEYLGDFAAGPLYSDGDIVVAADNIAYICVRPTNDPPVMWPGVGMATAVGPPGPAGPAGPAGTNAAIDATYWTVSNHPDLTQERALNTLPNGYLRNNGGEPQIYATIPLTDTTGTLPDARLTSNVALKNINNNFVAQTIGSYTSITGPNSALYFRDPSSPPDARIWRMLNYSNGNIYLEAFNDAENAIQVQFAFARTGYIYAVGYNGEGSQLTNLNASQLSHGTVNPARLGSGTANSTTFLRGDSTWQPVGGAFPSGLIVISVSPCPPGWTRVVWDGLFLRVGPTPTAQGGAWDHAHGPGSYAAGNHAHDQGTLTVNSHNHFGGGSVSGTTGNAGGHDHGVGLSGTASGNVQGSTLSGSGQTFTADGGADITVMQPAHTHAVNIEVNLPVSVSGRTDGVGDHSHSFSGSFGIPADSPPVSGTTGASAPAVTGTSSIASNLPPYIDIFLCQKD